MGGDAEGQPPKLRRLKTIQPHVGKAIKTATGGLVPRKAYMLTLDEPTKLEKKTQILLLYAKKTATQPAAPPALPPADSSSPAKPDGPPAADAPVSPEQRAGAAG